MTDANPAADPSFDGQPEKSKFEENLKSRPTWLRFLFMVFFAIVFNIAALVGTVVVVTGFLFVLLTGEPNQKLQRAGRVLATYLADIVSYLTYNTDTRPCPFDTDLDKHDDA